MKCLWLLCILLVPFGVSAQDDDDDESARLYIANEVSIGLGAAFPAEKDPFNIPGEPRIPTSPGINLGYRRYIQERVALGVRLYGYYNKLSNYFVTFPNSSTPVQADFTINTITIAFEGTMLFGRRPLQPYAFLMLGYVTGTLENDQAGSLGLNGVAGGGGVGIRAAVSHKVAIALEGMASFGTASWKQKPFTNSSGDKFNPSMFVALATVLIGWD